MSTDWTKIKIPQNYNDLYAHFGDPKDPQFQQKYLVAFKEHLADGSPVTVRCHAAMAPSLQKIWAANRASIHTYDGCYNYRPVRGSQTHLSLHSWGLAIDLNAAMYPLGSDKRQDHNLTQAFLDAGYWYGGNYHARKDPMHYQFAGDM